MKKTLLLTALFAAALFCSCSDNDELTPIDQDSIVVLEDSDRPETIPSKGFYIANEDWFGHDEGTVNYFMNNDSIVYRAYRAANPDETFGVTTQFATIYGDYTYFVSKQGNRLVVADAITLKKKTSIENIGGGDGRSFLGVNAAVGYVGTSKDIRVFDINSLTIGNAIEGVDGQVGSMCRVGNRAFAIVNVKGVYVINTNTHQVEELIPGSFNTLTQSKDGSVWIAATSKLTRVNPYTLETTEVPLEDTQVGSSWFAWNAGSLCASTQRNILYWSYKNAITKYDIDANSFNTKFYVLPNDETDKQLAFYGAGLRVDPLTDQLVLTVKKAGWGSNGSFNWTLIVNASGTIEKTIVVKGDNGTADGYAGAGDGNYYWFPAMPFFEDANAPSILLNQVILKPNERKAVCLSSKVADADNMSTAIIKNLTFSNDTSLIKCEIKQDSLILTSNTTIGKTTFGFEAISNGKIVRKDVRIDVRR